MKRRTPNRIWLLLLLALWGAGTTGCASRGAAGEGEGVTTFLLVSNNLPNPTSLSVYAVPQVGTRTLVGTVRPGATVRLSFRPPSQQEYRFLARTTGGAEILSNPVTVVPGEGVRWDLGANIATEVRPN